MPNLSSARNKLVFSSLNPPPAHPSQWKRWIKPTLIDIGLICLFIPLFLPNTIAASVATVIWLSLFTVYFGSLLVSAIASVVAEIKEVMADKPYPEHPLPTYEEIEQADEKQLPSYQEACLLEKKESVNLEMYTAPPVLSAQTYPVPGEPPPPYRAFLKGLTTVSES